MGRGFGSAPYPERNQIMGLDMYLTGERYFHSRAGTKHELVEERYRLGYWRKHPNLHGYLVETFADGKDDCREVSLFKDDLLQILTAIEAEELPHTEGFFFGYSDGSEKEEDIAIFTDALAWLETADKDAWRSVIYQASW
jgi:hypothetical protein